MIKWYFIIAGILCLILLVQQIWKKQFKTIWLIPVAMCFWPIIIVIGILNKPKGEKKIANAFNVEGLRFAQIYVKEKRTLPLGTKVVFQARGKGFRSKWMSEPDVREYLELLCFGYKMSTDLSCDELLDQLEGMMR